MAWPWAETCSGPSLAEPRRTAGPAAPPYPLVCSHTHQRLHDGMVGGVHVGVQGEGALPLAVVGSVALGRDDPVLRGEEGVGREAVSRALFGPDCRARKSKTP